MLAALVICSTLLAQDSASTQPASLLVAEEGVRYAMNDGVLELRGGAGWVRFRQPVADFDVEFEFQALGPDTDAGMLVRTWTGREGWPRRGYRLNLPSTDGVKSLFVGRRANVSVVQQGAVDVRPSGEWQRVQLSAKGSRIRVRVNEALAGEFEIDETWGYLLFESRKGRVRLRNIVVHQPTLSSQIPDDVRRFKEVLDAGGQAPDVVREVEPQYTSGAMRRRVEGVVNLEVLVGADGSIRAAKIISFLDPDLDLAALAAIRQWKFKPAVLGGSAVPVVVEVELTFKLK